jgi:hypothetical protein
MICPDMPSDSSHFRPEEVGPEGENHGEWELEII